jgi:hypothetical protein
MNYRRATIGCRVRPSTILAQLAESDFAEAIADFDDGTRIVQVARRAAVAAALTLHRVMTVDVAFGLLGQRRSGFAQ